MDSRARAVPFCALLPPNDLLILYITAENSYYLADVLQAKVITYYYCGDAPQGYPDKDHSLTASKCTTRVPFICITSYFKVDENLRLSHGRGEREK